MRRFVLISIFVFYVFVLIEGSFAGQTGGITSARTFFQEQNQQSQKRSKKKSDQQGIGLETNTGMLIDAKKEALIGNIDGATTMFKRYIERYPMDPVGYYELAQLEGIKKNYSDAINLISKSIELDPENIWYQLFLSELYQITGNYSNAIGIFEKIIDKNPDNLDYYYQLASLYLTISRYQDAIKMYDRIEEKAGVSEEISLQKEKIHIHLADLQKAEEELKNLIHAFPGESRYYSILAEFYMSNNSPDKAIEVYKKVEEIDPENAYIHMSMADYYRKTGKKDKAFEELKLGFANPNLDVDTKVNILLSFYSVNQLFSELKDEAFTLAKILLETHPADPKVHSIYGDLLVQDKKYEEARESFLKVIALDSSRYAVWEEILRLDLQLGEFQHLSQTSKRVIELFPEQPGPYLFSGLADYQLKDYQEGLKALTAGSSLVVDNDELLAQFYMYLGDTRHALKNDDEAYKDYEKSLQIKDNNAYVLNNYAYYLSLKGQELDKAETMAKKAVTLEPENSSFQDTYGWVMYKQGRFKDAREWIGKAIGDKENVSAEVLEHFGDVLFKLGEQNQALEYWLQAKKKGPGSENLEKKIREKRLVE